MKRNSYYTIEMAENYLASQSFGRTEIEEEAAYKKSKYQKALLRAIGSQLTEKQREVVLLYYRDNLTMAEIAEKTGRNKSTVCRHLQKAQKRVGNVLWCNML